MRILYALPYGPGVTRVRSRKLLSELCTRHDVTIVALAWDDQDVQSLAEWTDRGLTVHAVPHSTRRRVPVTPSLIHQPLQYVISRSTPFATLARELVAHACACGEPFDAVHIEHMRGAAAIDMLRPLGVRTVFDSVDCLAELARLSRSRSPNPVVRTVAGYEEARTRRMESMLIRAADVVTLVAERDRQAILNHANLDHVIVIPNGVDALDRPVRLRDEPDAVFTGKLSYHANQAAARWLLTEIWPLVRRTVPDATLTIAGADPPAWLSKQSGSNGVRVVANPVDMQRVLVSARVALAPVVYSVGIQNKVLEGMANGLPVVATSSAAAGLLPQATGCLPQADSATHFALETIRLLTDDRAAIRFGIAGFEYVSRYHAWDAVSRQFEDLYAGRLDEAKVA